MHDEINVSSENYMVNVPLIIGLNYQFLNITTTLLDISVPNTIINRKYGSLFL